MASQYKTTKSTHAVSNAFKQHGFRIESDGPAEYQTARTDRTQVWIKDVDADAVIRFRVTYNRDGHVTQYSSAAGYARTHKEGRSGGVWQRAFTPAMARELLISNLNDLFDGESYLLYRASEPRVRS